MLYPKGALVFGFTFSGVMQSMAAKMTRRERRQLRTDIYISEKDYLQIADHALGYGKRLSLSGFVESKWHAVDNSKAAARTKISTGNRSGRARIINP